MTNDAVDTGAREAEWIRAGKAGERPLTFYEAVDALDAAFADLGRAMVRQYRQDARAVWGGLRCLAALPGRGKGGRNDGNG